MAGNDDEVTGGGSAAEPREIAQSINANAPTVNLEDELKQSFIDYAMSVIVDRALPDVRDGLKPVHRRVLFDMYDLKVWFSGQTKKSARIVGDVIGRFHPHGDVAVYETIVRMTQWFSMREPLIFGQGNFGDIDGDGAAAMRYTEVKMTRIAEMMLQDIDKDTVNTYPNYDGNEQIPEVLPTRFPNLLVNGSSGIAVGMATNIPTHNLAEVIDGTLALLDNPDLQLDELMRYIPGPDFPTGGEIVGRDGVRQAYATGRGRCVIRGRTHIEEDRSGRKTIYVDEIPYVVHKVDIVKQIASLIRDHKLEGIAEINDLSDKDHQVRIAIDLKRDAFPEAVLNNLYQNTMLQSSFPINMVALVNNHPRQLSLKEILSEFVSFRREVVTRRTVFLLRRDRRKAHLDEGLIVAKANIQRVIDIITAAMNPDDARQKLMDEPWSGSEILPLVQRSSEGFNLALPQGIPEDRGLKDGIYYLSREQTDAILTMQLSRLTHLAQDEIRADYAALLDSIRGYLEILNNPERMRAVIREELEAVKAEYNDKRRTGFTMDEGSFDKADLIAPQDVIVTLSAQGYIKYQDIATYASQNRGGHGRIAARLKDEDFITTVVAANTHDRMMCFTSAGRVFVTMVYNLPTSENRTWRGRPVQNLFKLAEGEKVSALLPVTDIDAESYICMATRLGRFKKIAMKSFSRQLSRPGENGVRCITLLEGDELVGCELTTGDDDIYLFTSNGCAVRFCEYYPGQADVAADDDQGESDGTDTQDTADVADVDTDTDTDSADAGDEETVATAGAEDSEGAGDGSPAAESAAERRSGGGVRPQGRSSRGINGVRLRPGAQVVSLIALPPDSGDHYALCVTDLGFGKRLDLHEIRRIRRGGYGVVVMKLSDRVGRMLGAVRADQNSEYMLITDQGVLIRSPTEGVPVQGRYSGGCILMRVNENEHVIGAMSISEDVVENARRTSEARAAEKKAALDAGTERTGQPDGAEGAMPQETDVQGSDGEDSEESGAGADAGQSVTGEPAADDGGDDDI